jgi:hypothetical protein
MNLVLNKLSDTDIQFLNRPNMLNIGIRFGFRSVGRYYIFCPLTCNAAFRFGQLATAAATTGKSPPSIRTNTVKPTQLPPRTFRKRSEMVDNDLRMSAWSMNLSEKRPELRNPSQQGRRDAPIHVAVRRHGRRGVTAVLRGRVGGAPSPGLEPELSEPKSEVLPITPRRIAATSGEDRVHSRRPCGPIADRSRGITC